MLRNRLLPLRYATSSAQPQLQLQLQLAQISAWQRTKSSNAGSTNATRQSKILGKLFGNRVAGTKKRWYPSHDASGSSSGSGYQPPSVVFQASQFGKSNSPGSKHNTRRMSVLNKLFMTHITDLLATGEAAESILGRGLQVSRVKISSDFSCINVYWLGTGQLHNDAQLDANLSRCSGQLRHELSQLRLMGEVPRIKFVRDKTGSNINSVEGILRTLNLSQPEKETETEEQDGQQHSTYDTAQTARLEFYGTAAPSPQVTAAMPEMRHDVLGLDHRLIMDKILTKMRKSKSAWEQHQQQQQSEQPSSAEPELARMQRKMAEAEAEAEALASSNRSQFEAFLAKRRGRKQTPERKKHQRDLEDWTAAASTPDFDELQALTPEQRKRYTQEDYILEDAKDYRNS
ncbi:putative ribosome-binding factor A, mitochondrial [Drosophila novamexicana]|uniref:putative ribosome-binding factor A, mitochondrial n=1 Tax=Drosophila novamexicana TaxID=47314 RepID=UPI0011E5D21F|nr:putative ribosome-binding factor A, mitochondrial [Drosophila novamexicana]